MPQTADEQAWDVDQCARQIADFGREIGLPFIAVSADMSSPDPMRDQKGRPYVETLFHWLDPRLEYWKDRAFALKAPFALAVRYSAEPFYFSDGRLRTWRPTRVFDAIDLASTRETFGVAGAIIAPAYLPGGVIGAVVWATPDPAVDVPAIFEAWAARLQAAAIRFMSAHHDVQGKLPSASMGKLTRREIQCLKWAAAGKTDVAIADIVRISAPTVRFHLKNAAAKLRVVGRSQAVREAAALGYVGLEFNPARAAARKAESRG